MANASDSNSAPITFKCPNCGKGFRWKPEFAGKRVRCKCDTKFAVPIEPPVPKPAEPEVYEMDMLGGTEDQADQGEPGVFDLDALGGSEDLADGGPIAAMPNSDWMGQAQEDRKKMRKSRAANNKASAKQSRRSAIAGWGKFNPVSSFMFAIDIFGKFEAEPNLTRTDMLVGQLFRCAVFVALGITALVISQTSVPAAEQFKENATEAVGTIVSKPDVEKGGKRKLFRPERWDFSFKVFYEVQDTEYTQEVEATGARMPAGFDPEASDKWKGQTIELLYDAKAPDRVKVATAYSSNAKPYMIYFLAIGAFIVAGFYAFLAARVGMG